MPDAFCDIAWYTDPADGSPLWRDISDYVEWQLGARISRRRSHELDQVTPGTLALTLLNEDGRFTAGNTTSPYYPQVLINRPIRIRARLNGNAKNRLLQEQARGSDTSEWSATQGSLAVDTTVVPAGQSSSIRWTAGTLSNGTYLRLGSTSIASPSGDAIEVTAGLSYALQCQARRDASVSCTMAIRVRWFDKTGAQISETTGSAVTLTTSFQAITYTVTAPAGAQHARVVLVSTTSTASSVVIYTSAWQFEQASSPTAWADPGKEYSRYVGYVDKWPHKWANGVLGVTAITATDLQKLLGRRFLRSLSWIADNQASGARVLGLLAAAGVTTAAVDSGVSLLGLTGQEATQSLMQSIRAATASEAGLFFIDRDGKPIFHDRARRQVPSSAPVITLTGDQCGEDLNFLVDDQLLLNDVVVSTDDGTEAPVQQDAASISSYGAYSGSFQTLLQTAAEAKDRALYLLAQYAEPRPRAGQITVEGHAYPSLLPDLLGSEIGQRIQISGLPSNGPSDALDLWIEGIQDVITDQTWTFTFDPSPAKVTASLILDHPVYGRLNSGNYYGW